MQALSSSAATLVGCGAIALWSLLAVLTAGSGPVPPFQLVAVTFAVGGALGLAIALLRGRAAALLPTPASLALGVGGLFGDTALYFAAVRLAPPAEANLIHYLWPLLVVLFAALLPGGRLRPAHVAGAVIGLAATALIVGGRFGEGAGGGNGAAALAGYLCAFAGAFVWAAYSVLSRRLAAVASESIAVTLIVAAVLATGCHLALETTAWPTRGREWLSMAALGLGPIGAAFLVWDIGMKNGDVSFLGVASYAAPVLSTLVLVLAGFTTANWTLAAACALIVAGAFVASRDSFPARRAAAAGER